MTTTQAVSARDADQLAHHMAMMIIKQLDCADTIRNIHTPYADSTGTMMCDVCWRTYPCDSLVAVNVMLGRKVLQQ